jgi:Skp family chaperone for outer membrane proteins
LNGYALKGSLVLVTVVALGALGAEAVRTFQPPRTGVVDIALVFDLYDKKKDRQGELKGETDKVELKLKDLERRYKEIVDELPLVENGTRKNELMLQKYKLEIEVKELKDNEMKRLRDVQIKYLKEIRDEISEEINVFAEAQDLDLVLEKTVTAEGEQPGMGFRWPIVHFAKPELDITKEIALRLNSHYKKAPK